MTDAISNMRRRYVANLKLHDSFLRDTSACVRELDIPTIPKESNNFAVILEPRSHPHLEYVLRNVMYFLGDGWGLYIVCGRSNQEFVSRIVADWGSVWIETLDCDNLTRHQFRSLRKSANFWRNLKGEKLLCFESDALLCRSGVGEYLDYDYIGAPWSVGQAVSDVVRVGNGGLSIRSRQAMIDMCLRGKTHTIPSEDSYFSMQLHLHRDEYNLPDVEVAKTFSVETMYHPTPLGFHKPWPYITKAELLTIYGNINYGTR